MKDVNGLGISQVIWIYREIRIQFPFSRYIPNAPHKLAK